MPRSAATATLSIRIPAALKARMVRAAELEPGLSISITDIVVKGIEMACDKLEAIKQEII